MRPRHRATSSHVGFGYRTGAQLFDDLTITRRAGRARGPGRARPDRGSPPCPSCCCASWTSSAGRILVDGQDIRDVTLASLRRAISYVPQDPQLLHRTIAENICYGLAAGADPVRGGDGTGRAVDYDLVHAVGRAAHVEEFVYALPDGYDTVVGERGLKLSGGQRQRVAIAQAMAKQAPILVLDEATSALDSESEHLVQEALWRLMEHSTALVIAHRLSTIAHMDRIVVFDRGRIVEEGTHAELLGRGAGLYARLWQHQSGGFLVE